MPSLRHSYTVTGEQPPPPAPGDAASPPELRKKSPSRSRSALVSAFRGLIISQSKNKTPQGLVGLKNLGNTCFMNSIVQCLSNTTELRDYCLRSAHRLDLRSHRSNGAALMEEFALLLQRLWTSADSDPLSPADFRQQVCHDAPKFRGCNQQDAQEFLRFLLDALHSEVNRAPPDQRASLHHLDHLPDEEKGRHMWSLYVQREDSLLVDVFGGQLKSRLTCSVCGSASTAFDPFWDLSLPIAKKSSGEVTLRDCLKLFTRDDVLEGDESPTCERCKTRRKCTKRLSIQRFPHILVLHLKRFSDSNARSSKLSTHVTFPLKELDLREFSDTNERATYDLFAVSYHWGGASGGHYTACCRHPRLGEWYCYNDARVNPIPSSRVLSANAYVLFYELSTAPHRSQTCRL